MEGFEVQSQGLSPKGWISNHVVYATLGRESAYLEGFEIQSQGLSPKGWLWDLGFEICFDLDSFVPQSFNAFFRGIHSRS